MPDQYCKTYGQCTKLDGRLLINQPLEGPLLAVPRDVTIGDLTGRAVLRPYCHFVYLVRWIPKEGCQAPVRSVIGLAPGETMSVETSQVEQVDFARLVQNAVETSDVVTTSGPVSQMRDREGFDWTEAIWLATRRILGFGSFWEGVIDVVTFGPIGDILKDVATKTLDVFLGSGDSGGPGSGNYDAQGAIDQTLESVTHSESERTFTETTTSRSRLSRRTVTRTFVNPYRDRSLQLRFIPVFRRFEVHTSFFRFCHGLVLELVKPQFKGVMLSARLGDFIQRYVTDPRIVAVASSELGLQDAIQPLKARKVPSPLTAHLNANAEFYAGRYLRHLDARRDLGALQSGVIGALNKTKGKSIRGQKQNALLWSRTQVRGKGIYVPFADGKITSEALGMRKEAKIYLKALDRVEKFRLRPVVRKRDVHLFMGTHIEAVPGSCILKGI